MFDKAIDRAEPAETEEERVKNLIDCITFSTYVYTSRGLFERDKLIFGTMLTFQVLKSKVTLSALLINTADEVELSCFCDLFHQSWWKLYGLKFGIQTRDFWVSCCVKYCPTTLYCFSFIHNIIMTDLYKMKLFIIFFITYFKLKNLYSLLCLEELNREFSLGFFITIPQIYKFRDEFPCRFWHNWKKLIWRL